MLVPRSVKCPHWVLLGSERALKRPGIQSHTVLGSRLVSYVDVEGELRVVEDACPHRGASLGCGRVDGPALVCPYHALNVSMSSHPHKFYGYAALQGFVWVDYSKDLNTQHHMPPYIPSLTGMHTLDFTKVVDAHPLVLVEHLVGSLGSLVDSAECVGFVGRGSRVVDTPHGAAQVQCEYHAPYTCSATVSFGADRAAVVMASVLPVTEARAKVYVRVAHVRGRRWSAWVLRAARLALERVLGQVGLVGCIEPGHVDHLGPGEGLLTGYRAARQAFFPELNQPWT